jgi:hypothetical protein
MTTKQLTQAELGTKEGNTYRARTGARNPLAAARACGNAHLRLIEKGKSTPADVLEFGTAFLEAALK